MEVTASSAILAATRAESDLRAFLARFVCASTLPPSRGSLCDASAGSCYRSPRSETSASPSKILSCIAMGRATRFMICVTLARDTLSRRAASA